MERYRHAVSLSSLLFILLVAVSPGRAETRGFSLTTKTVGSGTIDVTPAPPYSDGQQVSLMAEPAPGWEFSAWTLGEDSNWADAERDFRLPVTVSADGFARKDKPVDVAINFQALLDGLGGGTFNPASVRVVEVSAAGVAIDDSVPAQFAVKQTLNIEWEGVGACATAVPGQGTVTFIMEGNTAAGASRTYHVYFDKMGKTLTPPSVPQLVKVTDDVVDEGQAAVRVETLRATYYYHKLGAGFSSLNDADGNDWISYNSAPEADGRFRGIPNAVHPNNGGDLHPGDKDSDTCLLNAGPIKATLYSNRIQTRTRWNHTWDVYPGYVRHTINEARFDYYWLYEGTPGGLLEPNKDFAVFSDGVQIKAGQTRELDIPGDEWGFVADPDVGRSIFLIKEAGDDKVDSYRDLDDSMTVFAFGRNLSSKPFLPAAAVPAHFVFGLMDVTTLADAVPIINNAFKPLTATPGEAEKRTGSDLGSANPLAFTITGDHLITARFVKKQFTLTAATSGPGSITRAPDKPTYEYNEVVMLTAVPEAGALFTGWGGDASGKANPIQVTMSGNKSVTASFAPGYTVVTAVNGEGALALDPPGPTYVAGTAITATAAPAPGWVFDGWSGDATGKTNPLPLTVNRNLSLTANFVRGTFTLEVIAGAGGKVSWKPKKDAYLGGEIVTLTAAPDPGYVFYGWSGDLVSKDNPATLAMVKNSSVRALFVKQVYLPLAIDAGPE